MKNTFVNLKNIINIFKILKDKKIIVWGTGNMAITICNNMPFNVEFFVDNNSENMHDGFLNKKVYSPEEVKKYKKDKYIIIVASTYFKSIQVQLEGDELVQNINYIDGKLLYDFINMANNNEYNEEMRKVFWDNSAEEIYLDYKNARHDYETLERIILKNKVNKVLDFGCGSGRLMELYKKLNLREVVVQDISQNAINRCTHMYPEYKFILGDIEKIEFESNYFDLVVSNRALSAVTPENIENTINYLCKISKLIYINEFQKADVQEENDWFFKHSYNDIFRRNGYKIIEKGKIGKEEYLIFGK